MITLLNVVKNYPNGQLALNNISLQIMSGEMVFIQGHSGAGKSTLLKLLGLLERPERGQILVHGQNLNQIHSKDIPFYKRQIGFISQNPQLLNYYSVFENVAMPLIIAGYEKEVIIKRVRAALNRVGLLQKERQTPLQLSEGEQQRVGIARAIVHKPKIVLADEPTGNLDPELSMDIFKLFAQFNQVGVTILIASHDASLIEQLSYRSLHLAQGKILPSANHIEPSIDKERQHG
tara:strand:- start:13730 stop:14431 length:702 start_codon:yes stop_codon:yes gene_type:complete